MITITLIFAFLYLLFFQIKTIRDYIMEYQRGYGYRWYNSIYYRIIPIWVQGYLLDEIYKFTYGAPKWAKKLLLNKLGNGWRWHMIDGWHQFDGLIFILPYEYILFLLNFFVWGISWYIMVPIMLISPFIPWYEYFNFCYHVLSMRKNKQWFRIWWIKLFRKEK